MNFDLDRGLAGLLLALAVTYVLYHLFMYVARESRRKGELACAQAHLTMIVKRLQRQAGNLVSVPTNDRHMLNGKQVTVRQAGIQAFMALTTLLKCIEVRYDVEARASMFPVPNSDFVLLCIDYKLDSEESMRSFQIHPTRFYDLMFSQSMGPMYEHFSIDIEVINWIHRDENNG